MQNFCNMTARETLNKLKTTEHGLTEEEAALRLAENGHNSIEKKSDNSLFKLFFAQFKDVMTLLLIAAAGVSAVIAYISKDKNDLTDTFIILFIILLNSVVGTVQQYRADRAIEGLKRLSASTAKVIRGGVQKVIDSSLLTVGDVIYLEEGDLVPADCRILTCAALKCDESALTGESQSVDKSAETIKDLSVALGSMSNMLFNCSFVVAGNATAVVTGVGRKTQIGEIADLLDGAEKAKSPLENSLNKLGKVISVFVICVAAIIFIMGACFSGNGLLKNFMTAVAVAVAAIPEGLPAVVTIIMALGVQRMSRENVVIRKLKSVETLGGCSCICSDKTGTLTQNKMRVVSAFSAFRQFESFKPDGELANRHEGANGAFLECLAVCSAVKGVKGNYSGDPTEIALKQFADTAGYDFTFEKAGELPFSSERKMMSVAAYSGGNCRVYTKGAPDILLKKCDRVLTEKGVREITPTDLREILAQNDRMSDDALRVIAFAYRDGAELKEENLVFIGLCGMRDGLKEGVRQAVEECSRAGISTVMITGDHVRTAFAIAKKAAIADDISQVVSGEELDKMSAVERVEAVKRARVFARVTPKHKNLIVRLKQKGGDVVAMTGDGVNDAPSVKSADIGIAMGRGGTDVTKSAADMVIADDNFTTIVTAVKEGRRISSNIKKTIRFFISTNLGEVVAILFAALIFFRYDFLLSTQLLWINLITDSFPVLALGMEHGDFDAMTRPPERAEKALFSLGSIVFILISGLYIAAVTFGVYWFALFNFGNKVATTMTFLTISFAELFHAFNVRSGRNSAFSKGALSNKILLATVAFGVAVNVALCFSPLSAAFGLVSLGAGQWIAVFALALSVIPFCEAYKLIVRLKTKFFTGRRAIANKKPVSHRAKKGVAVKGKI